MALLLKPSSANSRFISTTSHSLHFAFPYLLPLGRVPCAFLSSSFSWWVAQARFSRRLFLGFPSMCRHSMPGGQGPTNASSTTLWTAPHFEWLSAAFPKADSESSESGCGLLEIMPLIGKKNDAKPSLPARLDSTVTCSPISETSGDWCVVNLRGRIVDRHGLAYLKVCVQGRRMVRAICRPAIISGQAVISIACLTA
jgi:hypothetical protein